jgi:Family of unknown function (DUF5994)
LSLQAIPQHRQWSTPLSRTGPRRILTGPQRHHRHHRERHDMRGPRRSARPARIALATLLGGDIDGAWWPHTASVAGELPELVEALHRPTEPLWQQVLRQPHPDQDPVGVLNAQWADRSWAGSWTGLCETAHNHQAAQCRSSPTGSRWCRARCMSCGYPWTPRPRSATRRSIHGRVNHGTL